MAPLLTRPALESHSAPVGPHQAGRIWGAVKGQRRPSATNSSPCTATVQVPQWCPAQDRMTKSRNGWLRPRPKLQRCDATLQRRAVWRKFQPQFWILSPNEPMSCSHPPWVPAGWQCVTCMTCSPTADSLAGRRWRTLCCWMWTHILQLTRRPSDFEPVYHLVPMAKASTSHPQSQPQQHSLGPPAPQLLSPRSCRRGWKQRKIPLFWWTVDRGTKTINPGWNSPLNLPHGGRANSLLSIQTWKKFHQLDTLHPTAGVHPCLPALVIRGALLAAGCNLEH